MIETEKFMEALNTDEATTLMAEYTKLYLQTNDPEHLDDENHQKAIVILLIQQLSEATIPYGMDCNTFVIKWLKASIDNLKASIDGSNELDTYPEPQLYIPREYPKRSFKNIFFGACLMLGGIGSIAMGLTNGFGDSLDKYPLPVLIASFSIVSLVGLLMFINGIKKKTR